MTSGTGPSEPERQWSCPRTWLVPPAAPRVGVIAARAGAGGDSSTAETPSAQTAISSAQAAVVSRPPGRGVSHSRAAPAR